MAEAKTSPRVANRATQADVLDLSGTVVLGVFGSESDLKAMIRLPSGRIRRISRGDRFPGGQRVAGVDKNGLVLEKNGRTSRMSLSN